MSEITIVEIAKRCGVGVSTVSRAINNHSDINPETKKRIMAVIKETGYIPNNSARNLKRTDAKCIAVLVKGITNPFFSPMIEVVEQEVDKRGYALVLRHVEAYENEVDVALELEKEKRLRGIIFMGGSAKHPADKMKQIGVPIVFATIGSDISEDFNRNSYSTVSVDDEKESFKMVSHLIEMGHKKIAIMAEGSDTPSVVQLRLKGYLKALKAAGIKVNNNLIRYVDQRIYTMANGYDTAKALIESGEKFTALYCISDVLAIGALRAFADAGLKVPEDVSVAGFDGQELSQYCIPRLTTIRQPLVDISKETIRLIFDIIDKESGHRHIIFPGELIEGESTRKI
ncbi:MAG: LacI family DNA-binding transcriptional regulator [Butyrivibrio sp.]|uniref:LacI family DNA-binding transcriptional regulator n=1 Tax=Butyrivibrio sp. TaxID=28121 RepID=UPI001B3E37B1|nr:LacI family DNA-binding transcriptional regulator [Butyrivibrio sp.]MBP3274484.1 LacI family DNA-binding transcriptional regulator [Butyrivibrio sp.]MBP3278887.1 LacI family DNA-binding transcriptional regulator [Butyrivibrio sp.]MBP3783262.1 LacI family DNA-binding transcriptional regulator [Butyrivibrio sp.]MBP3814876.1 LacI family DNA-binding transcriptional regulator [Butyrivibrio sp.]